MDTLTAQYVAAFVLQRQILYLNSYFNLDPPTLTSSVVTEKIINH